MSKLPEPILKSVVATIVAKKALDLIEAQEAARIYLTKTGQSPVEADRIVAEVLNDIAAEYKKEVTDKGRGPSVEVEIVQVPRK